MKITKKYKPLSNDKSVNLAECQKYLLDTFSLFQKFCDKYKIDCFLLWGTLLGSVRDGGIIPWDDDIDLGITIDNFLVLKNNLEHLSEFGLSYYHYSTCSDTYSNEIRIYKKGFYKLQNDGRSTYFTPVCLDIFVAHKVSTSLDNKIIKKYDLKIQKCYDTLILKEAKWKSKSRIKSIARHMYKLLFVFVSNQSLHKKIEKMCDLLYSDGEYNYFFPDTMHGKSMKQYDSHFFDQLEDTVFEGINCKIPSDTSALLTRMYGDWSVRKDRSNGEVYNEQFIKR